MRLILKKLIAWRFGVFRARSPQTEQTSLESAIEEDRRRLSDEDRDALRYAKHLLEHPGLAAKITRVIGVPLEKGFELLPEKWADVVSDATRKSLEAALRVALVTLGEKPQAKSWEILHTLAVAATGAGGGAFGLAGMPVEVPLSTSIMLRSIAEIARSEGEQFGAPEAKLACLEVFALGSRSGSDEATESAYFLIRGALAKSVSDAAKHVAEKGLTAGAPAIVRLMTQLASRFGVNVSEKVAAQAIPALGAVGGAAINVLFIDHFQDIARGHFIVRRLERTYTRELVREAYTHL
jgi:EcsC family protein